MAYCTNTEVQNECKGLDYNSSSAITTTKVDAFIGQADAYIDSRLGLRYVTPITGAGALLVVKMISTYLVADRVQSILKTLTGNAQRDQNNIPEDTLGKKAERMIKAILAGEMTLSDATLVSSSEGVHSTTYDDEIEHTFEQGVDQW